MSAGLPVTEKPAIPTITGKEKAATVNKSSEDSRSTGYREICCPHHYWQEEGSFSQ